jgi:hypothetical protein
VQSASAEFAVAVATDAFASCVAVATRFIVLALLLGHVAWRLVLQVVLLLANVGLQAVVLLLNLLLQSLQSLVLLLVCFAVYVAVVGAVPLSAVDRHS